jgi:hypothetical protein
LGTDGIARTRLETGHGRLLATLFGTVRVTRCAWRKPGAGNYCPADAALSVPAGRHSHSLAELAAIEAARGFGASWPDFCARRDDTLFTSDNVTSFGSGFGLAA